jgi:purine-binding chemotaxis protein CheW
MVKSNSNVIHKVPTPPSASPQGGLSQGGMQQFATFRVGALFMGIELSRVQELMRFQEMASVPLAPPAVEGLINLRGQIVTALDMRCLLGLPALECDEPTSMNIILHCEGGAVSLLVDEICDVLDVRLDSATDPPENLPAAQRALIAAVYQLESCLLLVLNTDGVIGIGAD